MTLNILFLTVTIKKRMKTADEISQEQFVKKIEEEKKYLQAELQIHRLF